MTIKVNYNAETTLVKGYYPDSINYASIPEPFIEIEDSAQVLDKNMCVIDGIYQEYVKPLNQQLQEAKLTKITQLKANRNAALEKTWVASKAYEWEKEEEPEVYFEFSTKSTGIVLTEPHTIVFGALLSVEPIKYSCKIIEGESRREGYIVLNQEVAGKLSNHLRNDATTYVTLANEKEAEISACTTIEELEAIDITF